MVREEVVFGLKNALERGQSLESAMQSFISAGYSLQEVQEAAKYAGMGVVSSMPQQNQNQQTLQPTLSQLPNSNQNYQQQQNQITEDQSRKAEIAASQEQQFQQVQQQPSQQQYSQQQIQIQQQYQQQMQQSNPQVQQQYQKYPTNRMLDPDKKPKISKGIIGLIIVLIILAAMLGVMYFFGETILDMIFKV